MGIKITVGNYQVEVSTAAEAAVLLAELNKIGGSPAGHTVPASAADKSMNPAQQEEMQMLLAFLESIHAGGPEGASSKVVAHSLDVAEKGIGSRLTWIRKMLNGFHFDDKDVFVRVKIPRVGSFWKPGEKFQSAYEAVRRRIGG
ncbi:MAG TPA: hypothetical protein VMI15_03330 [Burkholderiales bacterium]|nr:hypothetical protein [Burkholderiales bacterium]